MSGWFRDDLMPMQKYTTHRNTVNVFDTWGKPQFPVPIPPPHSTTCYPEYIRARRFA